jgi:fructose-1,6-bisphosphatase/inositol monophosphatase family enzyme
VETTKRVAEGVVKAPIKTVVYIGENGQRTIVNYYGTLKELNEDNKSNEVILFKREF